MHVGINSLKPFPKNPRRGNVAAIIESLKTNGQFRPIVVQRKTRRIIAGNHTWEGAKALGWETIDVVYLDVDDDEAERIMLADNRTNDLATYDMEILGDILAKIPDIKGTGYTKEDQRILASAIDTTTSISKEILESVLHPELLAEDEVIATEDLDDDMIELGRGTHLVDAKGEANDDPFESAPGNLPGILTLKDDFDWKKMGTITVWNIPKLRDDMLMQAKDVQQNYKTYVPNLYKNWPDPKQGWYVVFRPGNLRGLKNTATSILSFFTYDEYFESWWYTPGEYVSKMVNAGFKFSQVPDFSTYRDRPRIEALWGLYRQRWMGRFMQEAGLKVVPHLDWIPGDTDLLLNYVIPSLPKKVPVAATQFQNGMKIFDEDPKAAKEYIDELKLIYNACKPDVLLVYAHENGYELVMRAGLPWKTIQIEPYGNVMHSYQEARAERAALLGETED